MVQRIFCLRPEDGRDNQSEPGIGPDLSRVERYREKDESPQVIGKNSRRDSTLDQRIGDENDCEKHCDEVDTIRQDMRHEQVDRVVEETKDAALWSGQFRLKRGEKISGL